MIGAHLHKHLQRNIQTYTSTLQGDRPIVTVVAEPVAEYQVLELTVKIFNNGNEIDFKIEYIVKKFFIQQNYISLRV